MSKADAQLMHFNMHRSVVNKLVDTVKEEDLQFRPWEGAMSLSELVWHMLSTSLTFSRAAATGSLERVTDKPALDSKDDVKNAVDDMTRKTADFIQSMSDDRFAEEVDMTKIFGRHVPAGQLLTNMLDHEIHHKGQLFTYARLCGVETLPFFVNASGE